MRLGTISCIALATAVGCSGSDSPTEVRPEFATACSSPKPKITTSPTAVTRAPGSSATAKFIATNSCSTNLSGWSLTTSRTGAVSSVGAPSRASLPTLSPGQSVNVFVSYRVGSSASGTVVLLARSRSGTTSFGYQGITVGTF